MPLSEARRFRRAPVDPPAPVIEAALEAHTEALNGSPWMYCGYAPLPLVQGIAPPAIDIDAAVDNQFRLGVEHGFETCPLVVTTSLRTSRFAPVLFWEVLHVLAVGGLWIDVEDASRCDGTALASEDFPDREYFRESLTRTSKDEVGAFVVQSYRKVAPTPLAANIGDSGWTFGILTSGSSEAGGRMAADILALDLPDVEVIFCGPWPAGAPRDPRVGAIDLDRPEPRGWITRKKNLIVDAARHENVCLLHDRFRVTADWADALRSYGACFSVLTFPQVFAVDKDRRFTQRYADYQVLFRTRDVQAALEARVFNGPDVLYAAYDDFYETAFVCGGLYVAKKSIWQRVKQDEGLFHCEWEDVTFGLECQRRGIPHRVNGALAVDSLTPHPMALTRIHDMLSPDVPAPGTLHVMPEQMTAAWETPQRFKPILNLEKSTYFRKVVDRFNAISDLPPAMRLGGADLSDCESQAQLWRLIERRVLQLPLRSRAEIANILFFLSDTIYNWPTCEVQGWIRANERAGQHEGTLARFDHVVGWGTGSLFRTLHRAVGRELLFVVDSREGAWGSTLDEVIVRPPSSLRELDATRTAVVVFSCFFDEISSAIRALGPFKVLAAESVVAERRFPPLSDMVAYFEEVERYYPATFKRPSMEAAA